MENGSVATAEAGWAPVARLTAPAPVALVAHTPFWFFEQAKELRRRGWTVSLFTATPRWRVDPEVADHLHIKLGWATCHQGLRRLSRFGVYLPGRWSWRMARRARTQFADWVPQHLDGVRILDALSSWGLERGGAIHRQGGRYVCNRGSSHIRFQKTTLEEECRRWSCPKPESFPDWLVAREEAEYESADAIMAVAVDAREGFRVGTPVRLFDVPQPLADVNTRYWTVSPDGQRFFVMTPPRNTVTRPIEVVTDVRALLNRK